ncbi:MAG TPA: VOC family protein [Alphaproteobacteria bacterium]|nr:VOC family protein [Alphaproteobacteria bacterium]
MIDHVGLSVVDFGRSKEFYRNALRPLGYELIMEFPDGGGVAGFGAGGKPDFWIDGAAKPSPKLHVALAAADRAAVDAFYQAAMAAGGRDNGKPGLRPQYHAGYYGAFVLDPDGHNIEAVTHLSE